MAETANYVYRDFVTDGIPASGKHDPHKPDIRRLLTGYETIINAFTSNGGLIYSSLASLNSDLEKAANSMAWVLGDAVVANNGVYQKQGASNTGSWVRVSDLPFSFIVATDVGGGTPDAIQATTSIPVSGSALVWLSVFEANTGSPVTVSFNGGAPLTIKTNSGADVPVGGLLAGMIVLGVVSGSEFRLVSDQASASIIAAAEAILVDFQRYYYGAAASDPTTDPNGNAPVDGALYFNTTSGLIRVRSGGSWQNQSVAVGDGSLTEPKYATGSVSVRALDSAVFAGFSVEYADREAVAATTVPAAVQLIKLRNRTASILNSSSGGTYQRVSSGEAALWPARATLQDASGAWFLLRPVGGAVYPEQFGAYPTIVVEAETKAWYDACTVKPTYLHLMHMDRTIRRFKWRGLWTKIKQFLELGGTSKADSGRNIKSPGTLDATLAGNGTHLPGVGYKGNGVDAFVSLGAWNTLIAQNAAFFMASFIPTSDATTYVVSSVAGTGAGVTFNPNVSGTMAVRLNSSASFSTLLRNYRDMDIIVSRRASTSIQVFEDGERVGSFSDTSTAVSTDVGALGRSAAGYSNETFRAWVVGNVALNADNSDAKALNWIMKEHVSGLGGVVGVGPLCDSIGFISSSPITEAQRLAGMGQAAEFAQRAGAELVLNMGVWSVSGTLPIMRSNLTTRGISRRGTIIAAANTGFDTISPLVSPGHYKGGEAEWQIDNLTLDGRASARGITDVGTYSRPGPSNASTDGSKNFRLTRLDILDPVLHGIDYSGTGVVTAAGVREYILVPNSNSYKAGVVSENGFISDIWAEQCGDDHITAHTALKGTIEKVKAFYPSGRHSGGWRVSCAAEADDGADEITIRDVFCQGHRIAVASKSHSPAAAPRNCVFENIHADFCSTVLMLNATATTLSCNHYARKLTLTNPWIDPASDATEGQGILISGVFGATIEAVHLQARGTESYLGAALVIGSTAANIHISSLIVENWKANASYDLGATVRLTSTSTACAITNARITGAGLYGVNDGGSKNDLNNLVVDGTSTASSVGVAGNGTTTSRALKVSGFSTSTSGV